MLNHYIMTDDSKKTPFVIVNQEEIPFGYPNAGLYRTHHLTNTGTHCPDCDSWTTNVHDNNYKQVVSGSHNDTPVVDRFNHRRYKCDPCGRTFMEPLPWLKPYQRMTEIGHQALLHAAGERTFKSVGEAFGRSGQNVGVHVRKYYADLPKLPERSTPKLIGIDEISLAKGKSKFRLVIYDLSVPWRPQLFYMHESRHKEEVITILNKLSDPNQVTAVAMDMWKGYKAAVEEVLPHVTIVIDAFHVIQASTKALSEVRQSVQDSLTKEQRVALKQDKDLFSESYEDLTKEEQERIKYWENLSPTLAQAIKIHQRLRELYRCDDFEAALDLLVEWEKDILTSSLEPFEKLHKTIWNWLPEILNRFVYRISNAKTEGKNNQLRTMNQQGFGYSLLSLQARMQLKEAKDAILKWRDYQKELEKRIQQYEHQMAA